MVTSDVSFRPTSGRRRLRFSLKMLFLATTLLAVWLSIGINRSQREKNALRPIFAAGGQSSTCFSYFYPFRHVEIVSFVGRDFTNEDLKSVSPHLGSLPGLTFLQLVKTDITDDGLRHLSGLDQLRTLHVFDNNITDLGLVHIKQLTSLSELDLSATLVSDDGLPHISAMASLRCVSLPGAQPSGLPPQDPLLARLRKDFLATAHLPGFVSTPAIVALQKSNPSCRVLHTSSTYSGSGAVANRRTLRP